MTDDDPGKSPPVLQHLTDIYRLLGKNEVRIAGLTRQLDQLLELLSQRQVNEESSKSDGRS